MNRNYRRYASKTIIATGLALILSSCAELDYYSQALSGQWQLLNLRRPLKELMADPATSSELRKRLELAAAMRDFASAELSLPENGSYRSYADLRRPFVVWNVFAAPQLSLEPREWCYPMVGCVSYRGYFDQAAAEKLAGELRAHGYDVFLGGVPAYSTLGWFDDPLLNTFVNWPAGRLAELVFHELAHQRLFIADDTDFNESFATFVGRQGAHLWLARQGTPEERKAYETYLRCREEFFELVLPIKDELKRLYASDLPDAAKRERKRRLFAELRERYQARKKAWGGYNGFDYWFEKDLNNAKLAALNTYTRFVPAFAALFEQTGGDFEAFYAAVKKIADLPLHAREERLKALTAVAFSGATHRQIRPPSTVQ